jgi:hypothetical protein
MLTISSHKGNANQNHIKILETAKMPHHWQMDQENVVFIHNGILLSHEEKWNLIIRK